MVNRQVEAVVYMFDERAFKGGDDAIKQIGGFKYLVDAILHRQYRYRNFRARRKGKKYVPKLIMLVANIEWDSETGERKIMINKVVE